MLYNVKSDVKDKVECVVNVEESIGISAMDSFKAAVRDCVMSRFNPATVGDFIEQVGDGCGEVKMYNLYESTPKIGVYKVTEFAYKVVRKTPTGLKAVKSPFDYMRVTELGFEFVPSNWLSVKMQGDSLLIGCDSDSLGTIMTFKRTLYGDVVLEQAMSPDFPYSEMQSAITQETEKSKRGQEEDISRVEELLKERKEIRALIKEHIRVAEQEDEEEMAREIEEVGLTISINK